MLRRDAISHRAGRAIPPIRMLQNGYGNETGIAPRAIQAQQDPTEERMTQIDETIDTNESPTTHEGTDRRAMLRKMAIGGAGAAVAAAALGRTAEAADGDPCYSAVRRVTEHQHHADDARAHDPAAAPTAGPSALSVAGAAVPATAPDAGDGRWLRQHARAERRARLDHRSGPASASSRQPHSSRTGAAAPAPRLWRSLAWRQIKFRARESPGTPRRRRAVRRQGRHAVVHGADRTRQQPRSSSSSWPAPPTSGAFHAIAPQRAYDSRIAAYTPNGLLAPNASRVVSVADGHNAAGAVTLANAVPLGATAVEINLTAADPTDKNFLAVAPVMRRRHRRRCSTGTSE